MKKFIFYVALAIGATLPGLVIRFAGINIAPLTATFIVRGDYIEITTQDRALSERIVRVT